MNNKELKKIISNSITAGKDIYKNYDKEQLISIVVMLSLFISFIEQSETYALFLQDVGEIMGIDFLEIPDISKFH